MLLVSVVTAGLVALLALLFLVPIFALFRIQFLNFATNQTTCERVQGGRRAESQLQLLPNESKEETGNTQSMIQTEIVMHDNYRPQSCLGSCLAMCQDTRVASQKEILSECQEKKRSLKEGLLSS